MCKIKDNGRITTVVLTKEIGEKLLAGCVNERRVADRHVNFLARSIAASGYNNSAPIAISDSGELLDGQHRLLALRKLGWPTVEIPVCEYADKEVTPEIRASFNKARPQTLQDTLRMCYGWRCSSHTVSVLSAMYKRFIAKEYCMVIDGQAMVEAITVWEDLLKEFPEHHGKNLPGAYDAVFYAMAFINVGCSKDKIIALRDNIKGRLNCASNSDIIARIHDLVYRPRLVCEGGSVYHDDPFRVGMAIEMWLNGKTTCQRLDALKPAAVAKWGDAFKDKVRRLYNERLAAIRAEIK